MTVERPREGDRNAHGRRGVWLPVRRSLRARMALAFLGVSVLTVIVVSGVAYVRARDALEAAVTEHLTGAADQRVRDVGHWVRQQGELVKFIAGIPSLVTDIASLSAAHASRQPVDGDAQRRVTALLDSARLTGVSVTGFEVLAPIGGRVLAATDSSDVGMYRVDQLYFMDGLSGPVTQNVYPSPRTGRPTMTVAAPVHLGGAVVAVLAAHLDLRQMDALVMQPKGELPIEAYLVDRFSDFVSSARFGRADFRRGGHSVGIRAALAGTAGSGLYVNYAGVPVIGTYRWIPDRELALLVESPQSAAFAPARHLLTTMLLVGLVAVLLLTVAVSRIAGHVAEPILSVARSAERVAHGDFEVQAEVRTHDEVGVLANSFNQMTDRLRSTVWNLHEQVNVARAAMDALRENQDLLQGIVDNAAMLVTLVDVDDRIVLVNRHVESLFGVRRSEMTGRELTELLPPSLAALIRESKERGADASAVEREVTVPFASGDRTFIAVAFPLLHADGSPAAVALIASDITERQRAEESRRQLEAQMQHAQKLESLGVLAGGIAHDFNNLLGAVRANAELALGDDGRPDRARHSIEQILVAVRRASELTRQMLAYAGRADVEQTTLDLNRIVAEMSELTGVSLSKKVALELELSPEPCWIVADPAQISQVVLNLVTNAAEAIGDAPGRVVVKTERVPVRGRDATLGSPADPEAYEARLVVTDTGRGMTDETKLRIFDPFFTTKESGRGLGLAAVLGIVKSIGGRLSVDSRVERGTVFEIRIPLAPPPAKREVPPEATPPAPQRGRRGCVLIVDDESMLRSVACRVLARAGFDVIEASDGVEALRRFMEHQSRITAIVLDMTMPGMDGAEVLQRIRGMSSDVPVVIASGYDARNAAVMSSGDEFVEFLQKPYGLGELVDAVSRGTARA